jgi:hypothetical protein
VNGFSDSPVTPSSSEVGVEPDPWFTRRREVPSHSPHFLELVDAARSVQDSITGSNPPDDVVLAAVRLLEDVRALLDPWQVPELDAPAGKVRHAPGRAQPVLLPFEIDEETSDSVRERCGSRVHISAATGRLTAARCRCCSTRYLAVWPTARADQWREPRT